MGSKVVVVRGARQQFELTLRKVAELLVEMRARGDSLGAYALEQETRRWTYSLPS